MLNTQKFRRDVMSMLWEPYTVNGQEIKGQSISYVQKEMRGLRWRNLGNLYDFGVLLKEQGFRVQYGTNSRNQKTEVVYL